MDVQSVVLAYVSVIASVIGLLLTYVIFNVNRREKQVKEERQLFSDAIENVHKGSEKSLSELEARAEDRIKSIQEEYKDIEKRVRYLEHQQITKEEVKSLLTDRVRPIEDSLKLLEREVREVTKDINKELKETATEITREVWTGLNQLSDIMRQLSNDLSLIKGQLKSEGRREND